MYSFGTIEGRDSIIFFLRDYFAKKEIPPKKVSDFLKCMLEFKSYEGVLIGSEILIRKNELQTLKHCIKKYLNKPGYLDPSSTYDQNLASFISCLNNLDDSFSNLDDYIQQMINSADSDEPPRFLSYQDYLASRK